MKIEVGKFYKTRDGHKVRIYATDAKGGFPIHGAFLNQEQAWVCTTWRDTGTYAYEMPNKANLDIISEWEDPKPRWLAWINISGYIQLYPEDFQPDKSYQRMPHLDEPEGK